ncbi:XYLT1 [Symbiodinium sp. CCMP2592]|nr:XYLT1 [Symbiodinium sp. CCMP2592]
MFTFRRGCNVFGDGRQNENATTTDRPHFSCDVKDHADVLGPHLEEACVTPGRTTRSSNVQANSTPASGMEEVDRKLTEELSMAKALLMLNNVSLCMDLDEGAEDLSAADVVRLKGLLRRDSLSELLVQVTAVEKDAIFTILMLLLALVLLLVLLVLLWCLSWLLVLVLSLVLLLLLLLVQTKTAARTCC